MRSGIEDRGPVRIVTLDNPPVNALSFAYSAELLKAIEAADADPNVRAVVITGANGLFSGGADINDFNTEPTPETKTIRDVIAAIERSDKTFVAIVDGTCAGGGLELALSCDYRGASERSRIGLPEIKLGLLPGSGGTQRLPRLIGAQAALEFMLKGSLVPAERAVKLGILDEITKGDLVAESVAFAQRVAEHPTDAAPRKRRVSERTAFIGKGITVKALPFVVSQAHKMVPPEDNGGYAAHKLIDAVEAAVELPFAFGIAREARLFEELARSDASAALRHIFFAERELAKIPSFDSSPAARAQDDSDSSRAARAQDDSDSLRAARAQDDSDSLRAARAQDDSAIVDVKRAGVVGAGTMGTGIAITFANAGIPCTVVDSNDDAVEKAKQTVFGMFMYQVQKGRLSQEDAWKRGQSIVFTDDYAALADADVVVEAVFESMDVKKDVFAKLDGVAKPECILASNTSTLNIDEIASATKRPDKVLGLHFFVPANIMPLLEIVRGTQTSPQVLATAFALAKKLKKTAVLSANAFGFIGNRMVFDYVSEAVALAEEGNSPARIDGVMKTFGFPMGPFAMSDLSGLDVAWHIAHARPDVSAFRTGILDRLVEMKRLGQKTMAGYFTYDKAVGKGREPIPDPEIEKLFAQEAAKAKIAPRAASDDEIRDRLLSALVNRGHALLDEGVALRPGDIDIVYVYGYGFPPHRGGPMWYADHSTSLVKEVVHA